ncbi:GntR family transcriptional regulator [Microtetraspora fusca]|uniref:GntR family transcriptional regulator n=1 Tax=Microtetraspora fusca TaxID=1997 RepID=A0ABW6VAU9_MICFU
MTRNPADYDPAIHGDPANQPEEPEYDEHDYEAYVAEQPDPDLYDPEQPALPIWQVIASSLRADILDGHYAPGAVLPSETELSKRYSVSRPTVRDAVKALVMEGLATVVRGRGTFVRAVPDRFTILLGVTPRPDLAHPGFTPTARAWGWTRQPIPGRTHEGQPLYDALAFTPANRDTAHMLGVRLGHRTLHRYAIWEHAKRRRIEVNSYTNADAIPDWKANAERYQADPAAFYQALQHGRGPVVWYTTVTARMPYHAERESLKIETGTPILLIRRVQLSNTGQPLEVTEIKAVAEEFETADINETSGTIEDGVLRSAGIGIEAGASVAAISQSTAYPPMNPDGPIVLAL